MKYDVISMGELVVDFLTDERDKGLSGAANFTRVPGGAPANVAAGIARLGSKAAFLGKVGADPFGSFLADALDGYGVDISHLLRDPGALTTLFFIASRSDGKKDMLCYRSPGADILIRPDEIPESMFDGAKIFHFGSLSLSRSPAREATFRALDLAKKHGLFISFDPNYRPSVWNSPEEAREQIHTAMDYAGLVKIADEEWETVTGSPDYAEGSKALIERGISTVAVTLGDKGCYFRNRDGDGVIPAPHVECIDTIGAGDSFTAALLYRFVRDGRTDFPRGEFAEMIRFAVAAGAISVTKRGAIPSLPTLDEINRMLESGRAG
ncbi:MAG: carbohydrate kinase [Brevinematales bacterium]|nr:carbohydrate kinase [Brevinematales bacterium]